MKFLRNDVSIIVPEYASDLPIDLADPLSQGSAVEYSLPANFSLEAHRCWDYFTECGSAALFEYKGRLVVTDESLVLADYRSLVDGETRYVSGPRWVCDSWEELEQILKEVYYELCERGEIKE